MAFSVSFIYKLKDDMTVSLKKAEVAAKKLNKQLTTGQKIAIRSKSAFKALSSTSINMGTSIKRGAAIAAAGIIGATVAFGKFERGTNAVFTLMEDAEIDKFGSKIKTLEKNAIAMNFSIQDSTKSMFDMVSGLGANEGALSAYNEAVILAKGGNTDLTSATRGMIAVMNAYELSAERAKDVSSALFTAQRFGVTTVEEMSTNIGKVAPIASQAGIGFQELSASLAVMTKGGLSTDLAATALKASITALINPSKGAEKGLKALGVPFGVTGLRTAGLSKTMERLMTVMKVAPDAIGTLLPNVRAMTGVLTLSDAKMKLMRETIAKMNEDIESGTGLSKAYARMMSGVAGGADSAKGKLDLLTIEIGEKLAPTMVKLLEEGSNLLDFFKDKGLIEDFGMAIGFVAEQIKEAVDAFKGLSKRGGLFKAITDNALYSRQVEKEQEFRQKRFESFSPEKKRKFRELEAQSQSMSVNGTININDPGNKVSSVKTKIAGNAGNFGMSKVGAQ